MKPMLVECVSAVPDMDLWKFAFRVFDSQTEFTVYGNPGDWKAGELYEMAITPTSRNPRR